MRKSEVQRGSQTVGPGPDQQVQAWLRHSWSSGEDQGQSAHVRRGAALPEASLSPPWELWLLCYKLEGTQPHCTDPPLAMSPASETSRTLPILCGCGLEKAHK